MTTERTYVHFLHDIRDAIDKADEFLGGMSFEEFEQDAKTVYAAVRALEIVGEASKNIPETFRQLHPEVPWKEMAGMRDKLAHRYFGVDLRVVWRTATQDLPAIAPRIAKIIGALEKDAD